jgi:hypothetical protein
MEDTKQVDIALDARLIRLLSSRFGGLIAALGPAAILVLTGAGTNEIFRKMSSGGSTALTWTYIILGVLSLICLTFSIVITMEVWRSVRQNDD